MSHMSRGKKNAVVAWVFLHCWKHPPVSTCILLPRQLKHTKVFLSQSTLIAHGSRWLQTLRYPVKPLWILLFIQWSFHYPCCPSLGQCCWHALIITAFSLNPLYTVLLFSNTLPHAYMLALCAMGLELFRCWKWNKP